MAEGVHDALVENYREGSGRMSDKENQDAKETFKINVLRVAKFAVGVPRLFVILKIPQLRSKMDDIDSLNEPKTNCDYNLIPPEVAQWQWHTEWSLMKDLLHSKKDEFNSLIYPNPHLPSPATDRFRRVCPIVCGLIKYMVTLHEGLNGLWWPSKDKVTHNTRKAQQKDSSNTNNTDLKILLYEDGFQYVCPAILNLNRRSKNLLKKSSDKASLVADINHCFVKGETNPLSLEISCCSEDPLQLRFLREFALTSITCHNNQLNVIQLPDKDIKHLNKKPQERNHLSDKCRELVEPNENLFGTQDCLFLLIQGGCKRWKEIFGSYIQEWMKAKEEKYQKNLCNTAEDTPPPVASISMMFELAQGMDEIFTILQDVVSKHNWVLHIDDPVNIYNTSRTSLFITCLLIPAESVCLSDIIIDNARVISPSKSTNYGVVGNTILPTVSSSTSKGAFVPLLEKVVELWIVIRKSLLQGVIGKN